ncbi:MAG: tRNA pseudouridine(38-40) synthase TruA [Sulfitobacter litoralis]|nr:MULTISPECIES: tRNA pseudouridine(38-40) synthase TruA [Sulfitobacter]MBQ0718384.1 tRNA pseudouridine(38-40) synthase TruA [Sulfitobacter litoralis]MBQ0766691.1 tRNA pseudouridine(38-40) synthase TruA [Sulfitobacter litoralis]MBQ0800416.1 tRNA pseudouridine(38-40) synthase TruA [Sulfitobacter litoralis]MCF7726862.1 tRNA pseudouridine(38-40) synthase TruA [Sulfitobacter sp. M22]MCF7778240.1 tRNA pseudouridine(38-40) synthase TruA [Sulfitobacter sp. M220]
MQRYALKIEYHGAPFVGWQRQIGLASVQGAIEDALAKIEPRVHNIAAAGRTDAGVHGLAQVAHCDMERDWTPFRLSEAINYHLKPLPVAIVDCVAVDDDFHARFSAQERRYLFRVLVRRAPATHQAGLVWQVKKPLNIDLMREGASHLIGEHDFTTFRSTICQAQTPVKTLDRLEMKEVPVSGGVEVHFDVRARSFLHNQVRSIVGTLERVGAGSFAPDDVRKIRDARERTACGPVSPPHGLYLSHVTYKTDPFAQSTLGQQ